jgi:hypothetical protein
MMLGDYLIVSLPIWVGKRQVTAKAAGAAIAFRIPTVAFDLG